MPKFILKTLSYRIYKMGEYEDVSGLYSGSLKNGIPHGEGFKEYRNNIIYYGTWNNGARHGKGTISLDSFSMEVEMENGTITRIYPLSNPFKFMFKDAVIELNSEIVTEFNGSFYDEKIVKEESFGEILMLNEFGPTMNMFETGFRINSPKEKIATTGRSQIKRGHFRYDGDLVDGQPDGRGKLYLHSKLVYEGEMKGGYFHGKGKFSKSGLEIFGNFVNGQPSGDIKIESKNLVYNGQMLDGKYHGYGHLQCEDFEYKGEFKNGKILYNDQIIHNENKPIFLGIEIIKLNSLENNGLGNEIQKIVDSANILKYKEKEKEYEEKNIILLNQLHEISSPYDSFFGENDEKFQGKKKRPKKNFIEMLVGQLRNFNEQEQGENNKSRKMLHNNNAKSFTEDEYYKMPSHLRTFFKVKLSQGEYFGEFANFRIHGKGRFRFFNGEYYEGLWIKGKMHGYGVYKYANGCLYTGNFTKGIKNGNGQLQLQNGLKIIGTWAHDILEGEGNILCNGAIINAKWTNGKICKYGKLMNNNSIYFVKFLGF